MRHHMATTTALAVLNKDRLTVSRSNINVTCVRKTSGRLQLFVNINERTPEKGHLNVPIVIGHSAGKELWKDICWPTLETGPTNVFSVTRHSVVVKIWIDILQHTPDKSRILVLFVARSSRGVGIARNMNVNTLKAGVLLVLNVARNSAILKTERDINRRTLREEPRWVFFLELSPRWTIRRDIKWPTLERLNTSSVKKDELLQIFRSDGLPAEIDQIKYLIQLCFFMSYLFASLPVVVVLCLLMATRPAYLSVLLQWSNYPPDRSSNEVKSHVRISTVFFYHFWIEVCVNIQLYRVGKCAAYSL